MMETSRQVSSQLKQQLVTAFGVYYGDHQLTHNLYGIRRRAEGGGMEGEDDDGMAHTEGHYLIWNAVPSFVHFVGLMMGSLPLMRIQATGIRDRVLRLGVSTSELLFVHMMMRLVIAFVQNLMLLLTVLLLIRSSYRKTWYFWGALMAMLAQTMCGFSLGVLMQSFFDKPVHLLMTALVLELLTCAVAGE